jgi:hypothetical protein
MAVTPGKTTDLGEGTQQDRANAVRELAREVKTFGSDVGKGFGQELVVTAV